MGGGDENVRDAALEFALAPEYPSYESGSAHSNVVVDVSLTARELLRDEEESSVPLEIVTVIDRSGSMAGSKLNLVKQTLNMLVARVLKKGDRLSIVTFDDKVATPISAATIGSASDRTELCGRIDKITAGATTNLSGGLFQGVQQAKEAALPGDSRVSAVLLFTDGLANVGVTKTEPICQTLKTLLEDFHVSAGRKCTVHTFGFGSDHSEEMLAAIAEAGRGMYSFLQAADDIPKAFAECLGGLTSVSAQNITLTMEAAGESVLTKALGKYEITDSKVFVGDMYEGEERDVLVEMQIPKLSSPEEKPVAYLTVSLSYIDVVSSASRTVSATLYLGRPAKTSNLTRSVKVATHLTRIRAAQAIEDARAKADAGNFAEAQDMLFAFKGMMKEEQIDDEYGASITDDIDRVQALCNEDSYARAGRKDMTSAIQSNQYQRSTATSGARFKTKKKASMFSKMFA